MNLLQKFIAYTAISTTLFACSKETITIDPTLGLTKITEGFVPGAATKAAIYSTAALQTGYNPIYIVLTDSLDNSFLDNAQITLNPMMDMMTMKHTCPIENPASTKATDHLFTCSAFFIMPSGSMGTWTLSVQVTNLKNNKQGTLTVPVTIGSPTYNPMLSFTSKTDGGKYFVALVGPTKPKIGINDIELAIYKKQSMMLFPADSSMTVHLTPEMPSMGHGSPNNIDPVHVGNGHYKGKVNFTMTGQWRLNLDFYQQNLVADSVSYIDLNF